jgi:hypothetical protein
MMLEKTKINLLVFSGTIATVGALGQVFSFKIAPYVFSVGALGLIVLSFITMQQFTSDDFRMKRLYRINFITSLFLALSAYLMFTSSSLWVLAILIYAVNALFLSFRIK